MTVRVQTRATLSCGCVYDGASGTYSWRCSTHRVQTRANPPEGANPNTADSGGVLRTFALIVLCVAVVVLLLPDVGHASVVSQIRAKFGKKHDDTALCIARHESGLNPRAVSPTDDHGLFQIHNGLTTYGFRIYEVAFNIQVAYRMSRAGRSWWPWTGTWGRGLCRGLT